MVRVQISKLDPNVEIPTYKTEGSSGVDLMAFINKPIKSHGGIECILLRKKYIVNLSSVGLNKGNVKNHLLIDFKEYFILFLDIILGNKAANRV